MSYIVIDIETAPQPPERFMLGPALSEEEGRHRSSLEPLLGGIVVAVGLAVGEDPVRVLTAPTVDEAGEAAMLARLEAGLLRYPDHTLVSWNGEAFDLPFLRKRALRHGLCHLARRACIPPGQSARHVDLRSAWTGGQRNAIGRLKQVCQYLGIGVTDEVSGADVALLLEQGQEAEVVAHCASDVSITRELLHRFADAGWVDLQVGDVDWSPRAPRPAERDQLYDWIMALEAAVPVASARTACAEAGIGWSGEISRGPSGEAVMAEGSELGPQVTLAQLRRYLAALEGL